MPSVERLKELLEYDAETGEFRWLVDRRKYRAGDIAGAKDGHGYIQISFDNEDHKAHRLAWLYMTGSEPAFEIDHKDRRRDNNAFSNLRPCSSAQNKWNASISRRNRSGVRGVCWSATQGKWQAAIMADGKRRLLGLFDDFGMAVSARKAAEATLHKEFSPLHLSA